MPKTMQPVYTDRLLMHVHFACVCVYGCGRRVLLLLLSFGCPLFAGITRHSRPEFIYFWFYFVIANSVWIVVPALCIVYAARNINRAVAM